MIQDIIIAVNKINEQVKDKSDMRVAFDFWAFDKIAKLTAQIANHYFYEIEEDTTICNVKVINGYEKNTVVVFDIHGLVEPIKIKINE